MRHTLLLLSVIFSQLYRIDTCLAQETFSEINVKLSSTQDNTKESFVLTDPESGGIHLILSDYRNVYVYEIDSLGKVITERIGEKPNYNHGFIIGASRNQGITEVYLTNSGKTSFSFITFRGNESKGRKLEINTGNERFLQAFQQENNFYLVTLKKYTSVIAIYKVKAGGELSRNVIDLSRYRFRNSSRNTLYTALADSVNRTEMLICSKIRTEIPNTFDEVASGAKLYSDNNRIVITLDHVSLYTIVINIDLNDFSYRLNSYQQPNVPCDVTETLSNSFLYLGFLYQVKFCNQEIHFQIYDTTRKEVVARHLVNEKNFESFRNSYFTREGVGNERIKFNEVKFKIARKDLDTSKITISKIAKGLPAITVFESNGQNIVSIGRVSSFFMYAQTNPIGLVGGTKITTEWVKYFRTLLDNKFYHQEGEIIPTVYDEIRIFEETNEKKELARQLFLWKGNCMYGYYDKELQKYVILKFRN